MKAKINSINCATAAQPLFAFEVYSLLNSYGTQYTIIHDIKSFFPISQMAAHDGGHLFREVLLRHMPTVDPIYSVAIGCKADDVIDVGSTLITITKWKFCCATNVVLLFA